VNIRKAVFEASDWTAGILGVSLWLEMLYIYKRDILLKRGGNLMPEFVESDPVEQMKYQKMVENKILTNKRTENPFEQKISKEIEEELQKFELIKQELLQKQKERTNDEN
jgi:hypothetical protein